MLTVIGIVISYPICKRRYKEILRSFLISVTVHDTKRRRDIYTEAIESTNHLISLYPKTTKTLKRIDKIYLEAISTLKHEDAISLDRKVEGFLKGHEI